MARENKDDWKNRGIPDQDKRTGPPKLTPELIAPATSVVVTIAAVDRKEVDDADSETGKRNAYWLEFEEWEGYAYWLNKSGMKTLEDKLGARPAEWVGESVPLETVKVDNPRTGGTVKNLHIVAPGEWDEAFSEAKNAGRPKRIATARGKRKPK